MKRATYVDVHVGRKLKLRRVQVGMSLNQLGKLVGINFQQILKYEQGVNRVSSGMLYKFSKVLEVPVIYFFEGLNDETKSSNKKFGDINYKDVGKELLTIIRLLNNIPEGNKKINLIQAFKTLIKSIE